MPSNIAQNCRAMYPSILKIFHPVQSAVTTALLRVKPKAVRPVTRIRSTAYNLLRTINLRNSEPENIMSSCATQTIVVSRNLLQSARILLKRTLRWIFTRTAIRKKLFGIYWIPRATLWQAATAIPKDLNITLLRGAWIRHNVILLFCYLPG